MIPEKKQFAVKKALRAAFDVDVVEHIEHLTKGLSSALVFKIIVRSDPYLLRIVTREDALADPTFYFGCMSVAAENRVAPQIHYLSIEDRISITDFINEQTFPLDAAR